MKWFLILVLSNSPDSLVMPFENKPDCISYMKNNEQRLRKIYNIKSMFCEKGIANNNTLNLVPSKDEWI